MLNTCTAYPIYTYFISNILFQILWFRIFLQNAEITAWLEASTQHMLNTCTAYPIYTYLLKKIKDSLECKIWEGLHLTNLKNLG